MPEIYISYAWRDRETDPAPDDRETIVDRFCEAAETKGFSIRRDKTAVGYRDSIESFMRQIGAGKYVLAVISPKYLQSEPCMFEAMRMLAHERFEERIFPIVMPDTPVFDAEKALDIRNFWREKSDRFAEKLKADGLDTSDAEFLLKLRVYKEIHENIGNFITRVARLNVLSPKVHLENGFADIFAALEKQIERDGNSDGVTSSHPVTTAPLPPEPVFQKLPLKNYSFEHALRPAQLKSVVSKLPASLNLIAGRGQGCFRLIEDFDKVGLSADVHIISVKLSAYLTNYDAFLEEIAWQGKCKNNGHLVGLLRNIAFQHNKPVLFILENLDDMYTGKPNMHHSFDIGFLQQLNALKNASFVAPLVCSHRTIKGLSFQGQSSPFAPEAISINALSFEDIDQEIKRRLPDLDDSMRQFIGEQLEFEPNQTYDILDALIGTLDSHPKPSRDFIGQELRSLRLKFGQYGR